jgi:ferrochelatase
VRALRAAGFDTLAIVEISPRAADRTVIEIAVHEDRIVLTEDKDFGRLVYAERADSAGVILIRIPANLRNELPVRVLQLVNERGQTLAESFTVIGPRRVRISRPPSGGSDATAPSPAEPRQTTWRHIQRDISECRECVTRWASDVTRPLGSEEIPDPPERINVLFVGVAPTRADGTSQGQHFYSDSRDRLRRGLFKLLHERFGVAVHGLDLAAGNDAFHRAHCFFVHAAKIRPVGNDAPPEDALAYCAERHLADEIEVLNPRAICFLGLNNLGRATQRLFGRQLGEQGQPVRFRGRDLSVVLAPQPRRGWIARTEAALRSIWQPAAVLLVAFGGPTAPHEIEPFLENVTRGRRIPPERLAVVRRQYDRIGGRSPLNELTFAQARALEAALASSGRAVPVVVGMRNWRPSVHDALGDLAARGVERAVGVILSPLRSEASWDRYMEDVRTAAAGVPGAPAVEFAPAWSDLPGFRDAVADRARDAFAEIPAAGRAQTPLVFTAHSIPVAMAETSPYVADLTAAAGAVAGRLRHPRFSIAYQSRSGDPSDPWLEPDVNDVLRALAADGARRVVIVPIGFVVDHVEVLFDLDVRARETAAAAGIVMHRAATVGDHPAFITALAERVVSAIG